MVIAARAGHLQVGHGRRIGRLWPKPIRRQQPKTPFFTGVFIAFFGCSLSAMKKHKRAFEKQRKTQKLLVENKKSWLSVPARVSADRLVAQLRQGGCLMGGNGLSRHYAAKALSGSLSEELEASTHVTVNYKKRPGKSSGCSGVAASGHGCRNPGSFCFAGSRRHKGRD